MALAALVPSVGRAASPEGATIDPASRNASWSGGPFPANSPRCTGAQDPLCDHFALTVGAYEGHAAVDITVVADRAADDVDFELYSNGTYIAGSSLKGKTDRITVFNLPAGTYEVRVQPYRASGGTYSGTAELRSVDNAPNFDNDTGYDCIDSAPDHLGAPALTDDGKNVELNVLVLLDSGVPLEKAQHMIAVSQAKTYDGPRITLKATYEEVTFPSDGDYDSGSFGGVRGTAEGTRLIEDAKRHVGGKTPAGIDVVYVLSNKDLWNMDPVDGKSYGLLGVADCIGGVRYDDRSFVVGEWITGDAYSFIVDESIPTRAVRVYGHLTAKVFSHELGHILGAHHHYGNCVQGTSTDDTSGADVAPCTLMFPEATLIGHGFGALENAVVRGYTKTHG